MVGSLDACHLRLHHITPPSSKMPSIPQTTIAAINRPGKGIFGGGGGQISFMRWSTQPPLAWGDFSPATSFWTLLGCLYSAGFALKWVRKPYMLWIMYSITQGVNLELTPSASFISSTLTSLLVHSQRWSIFPALLGQLPPITINWFPTAWQEWERRFSSPMYSLSGLMRTHLCATD